MNQFIFCVIVDAQIIYGTMKATDGRECRQILQQRFRDRNVKQIELKGVANKLFDADIVGGIVIP